MTDFTPEQLAEIKAIAEAMNKTNTTTFIDTKEGTHHVEKNTCLVDGCDNYPDIELLYYDPDTKKVTRRYMCKRDVGLIKKMDGIL